MVKRAQEELPDGCHRPRYRRTVSSGAQAEIDDSARDAVVPMVRVRLITSVWVSPHQSVPVQVKTDTCHYSDPLLIQYHTKMEESLESMF